MKKSYRNNQSLALEIVRGKWLIQDAANFRSVARIFLDREAVVQNATDADGKPRPQLCCINGKSFDVDTPDDLLPKEEQFVLVIPMHGCLTKYDNCMGVATMEVVDILEAYRQDESIIGFILDIDSPGGSVAAVMPLVDEIRKIQESGKPIISHVDDCCSAAYWIASQTDAIFADNILSMVGSIGAYCEIFDDRENKATGARYVDIYAPQSSDKNRSYREALDGKYKLLQKELSDTVDHFIAAVKAGRPDIQSDAEGVMSGAVFEAAKAIDLGMVNGMARLEDCIEIVYVRANSQ